MHHIIMIILAAMISLIGSFLGVGGGVFLVPALVLLFHLEPVQAMPIALMCTLATGFSGSQFINVKNDVVKKILLFEPGAVISVLFFAHFAHRVSGSKILLLFSFFIIFIAILATFKSASKISDEKTPKITANFLGVVIGILGGACTGIFGVGGGIILVPMFRIFLHSPIKEAMQISLSLMISTSAMALIVHASKIEMPWILGLSCMAAALPAASLGRVLRNNVSELILTRIFIIMSVAVAMMIWWRFISDATQG